MLKFNLIIIIKLQNSSRQYFEIDTYIQQFQNQEFKIQILKNVLVFLSYRK